MFLFYVDTWDKSPHQFIVAGWLIQLPLGAICCTLANSSPRLTWILCRIKHYLVIIIWSFSQVPSNPLNNPTTIHKQQNNLLPLNIWACIVRVTTLNLSHNIVSTKVYPTISSRRYLEVEKKKKKKREITF